MNKLLSVIAINLAALALATSAWTIYQLSQLKSSIKQQQETITQQQNVITQLSQEIEENKTQLSSNISQQSNSDPTTRDRYNTAIEPGQFVRQGVDNRIKIELLSVKRIQNPDTEKKDVVVVQIRLRRIITKGNIDSIRLSQSKGRNPETSEVYRTINNKSTSLLYINRIPEDSWGNAYFWLQVPEGVDVIDIVIPKTAIFENVPVSS